MIISRQFRIVYVSPPKTASTTMHTLLSQPEFGGEIWGEQHDTRIPHFAKGYLKIATIRNPFKRMVSLFIHRLRSIEPFKPPTFFEYLQSMDEMSWFYSYSQYEFFNHMGIDRYYDVDQLDEISPIDLFMLNREEPLPIVNAAESYDWRDYYQDRRCLELVEFKHKMDFGMWNLQGWKSAKRQIPRDSPNSHSE